MNAATEYAVVLTNYSNNPMTMAGLAITFSDPGFQVANNLLNDGSDFCSNQQLAAYGTTAKNSQTSNLLANQCQINIVFSPTSVDAPNPITEVPTSALTFNGPPNQLVNNVLYRVVNANIVAAGTANISSTTAVAAEQNILVTNYAQVSGSVTNSLQGATLVPVEVPAIVVSPTNPPPIIYTFGSPTSQLFEFTNNYKSPVYISQVAYSDGQDYSTISTPAASLPTSALICTPGIQVPANGGTCYFTVQYSPQGMSGTGDTSIAVIGTMPAYNGMPAWNNGDAFQMATAGAVGSQVNLTFSVDFQGVDDSETYQPDGCACWLPPVINGGSGYGVVSVSNPGSLSPTLTFNVSTDPNSSYYNTYPQDYDFDVTAAGAIGIDGADGVMNGYTLCSINPASITTSGGAVLALTATIPSSPGSCAVPIALLQQGAYPGLQGAPNNANTFNGMVTASATFPSGTTITGVCCSNDLSAVFTTYCTPEDPINQDECNWLTENVLTITVSGSEQSNVVTVTAAPASGSIALSAVTSSASTSSRAATAEAARRDAGGAPSNRTPARLLPVTPTFTQSTISAGVGGFTKAVNVPLGTVVNDAATLLAKQLNAAGSPVTAAANGSVVNLTSVTNGSATNLPLSAFVIGDYQATPSGGALTGGRDAGTTTNFDSGTVQVVISGTTVSVPWGSASTPQSIATALAAAINQAVGSSWKATASGSVVNLKSVSSSSTSTQAVSNKPETTVRRVRSEARGASSAARTAAPAAARTQATGSTTSSAIQVTVTDTAGFSTPSFSAKTN